MRIASMFLAIFTMGCLSGPQTTVNSSQPVQAAMIENQALEIQGVHINGAITEYQLSIFIKQILEIDKSEPYALIVINSMGGQMDSGFKISKAIEQMSIPTVCLVDVNAYSMAVYILQSCDYRLITTRGSIMLHNPRVIGENDGIEQSVSTVELVNKANFLRVATNSYFTHTLLKTKITRETVDIRLSSGLEWYFTATESLQYGLVDGVVKNIQEAKEAAMYKYKGKLP